MRALLKRIAPGNEYRPLEQAVAAVILAMALIVGAQLVGGAMFDAMAGSAFSLRMGGP